MNDSFTNAVKSIKEEREFAVADICTVVVDNGAPIPEPNQKIILSPRIEIQRVHKPQNRQPGPPDDQPNHQQIVDQHPPPQVIFTTSSSRAANHMPSQSPIIEHGIGDQQQPLQRVQVIKDGRCFYAEESISVTLPRLSTKDNGHNGQSPAMVFSSSSPPPLLIHQPDSIKMVLNRQVNVISNFVEEEFHSNTIGSGNGHQAPLCASSQNVFRPPVVSSSSSTPMRPPPPPPPPRVKASLSEEPSSSIPDLGELYIFKINADI